MNKSLKTQAHDCMIVSVKRLTIIAKFTTAEQYVGSPNFWQ